VQDKKITNQPDFTDISGAPKQGRIMSLDLGTKKVGIAVCDDLQIAVRPVCTIKRGSWKKFLKEIISYLADFDAKALVLGLPLNFDGSESEMSQEARKLAGYFHLSLDVPVYLQDERVSTYDARKNLWDRGLEGKELQEKLDGEAAAIILDDFLALKNSAFASESVDDSK